MSDVAQFVEGSRKLTDVFGKWPSFHDAEVVELSLQRDKFVPVLTAKIHHWETTSDVDASGHFVVRNQTLTTFRFHSIDQCRIDGFNGQNVISDLVIEQQPVNASGSFSVEFVSIYGIGASFICSRIEIVESIPHTGSF